MTRMYEIKSVGELPTKDNNLQYFKYIFFISISAIVKPQTTVWWFHANIINMVELTIILSQKDE